MATLQSLKSDVAPAAPPAMQTFYVYNMSRAHNSGGKCCLWTVPDGVTQVTFELWGGGGGGAGARCCQSSSQTAAGGAYSTRTISTVAGCQYTICAGGSSCRSNYCVGCTGYTSYVSGSGISTTCAGGGCGGMTQCFYAYGSTCCPMYYCTPGSAGDFTLGSIRGNSLKDGCLHHWNDWLGHNYMFGQSVGERSVCNVGNRAHGCAYTCTNFPGGGGPNGRSCCYYNCYCGDQGAGGLIKVSFA